MNKKKAIKLVTASALAASSFAAVAPFNTEAAVNVASSVKAATDSASKAFHAYSDVAAKGKVASVATVQSAVKSAQTSYQAAKKIVNSYKGKDKSAYLAKLAAASKNITLAQNYITAVNYATGLKNAAVKVDKATQNNAFSSADFSLFAKNLNSAEKTIRSLVSGKTAADAVVKSYLTYPKAVYNLVGGYSYANAAYYWMAKGDLTTAQARLDSAAKYFSQGPTASNLGKAVNAFINKVKADYAAKLAPKVESVSAINAKQIVVKFNTELTSDAIVVGDASEVSLYSLGVVHPTSAVLSDDKKSVTLTFAATVEGNDQVVVVDPVATTKKKDDGTVVSTAKYSQVFSYKDEVKPVVVGTSYANGKITLEYSEPVGQLPTVVRVNGTPVTAIANGTAANKVDVTYNLAANSTAALYVAGAKDTATVANEMDLYNGTVIAPAADTGKPQVVGVQVTGQNTAKVTLSEAITSATVNATLQKGANQTPVTLTKDLTDATGKTYTLTVDLNGPTAGDGIFSATSTSESFTLFVAAGAMTDTATPGNTNDLFSTSLTFNKDVTAPALVSSQVSSDNKKLEFTFGENLVVAGNNANIVVKNADGVKVAAVDAETIVKATDAKTYQVDTKTGDVALDAGTYTVSIPAGFFTDAYGNQSAAVTSTFTVGTATSTDTTKPTGVVSNVLNTTNTFAVAYSEEVSSTALNLANYKLDGQSLPAGTEIYFTSTAKTTVNIVLPANSINIGNQTTGASAILTVAGVADKAGNVINTANSPVVVKDNTAATVTNVQVLGTDVYVTFNEDVTVPATTDALAAFDVTVNGTALTAADVSDLLVVTGNTKQVKFTLATAPAAAPVVKVKAAQTVLTDANGVLVK